MVDVNPDEITYWGTDDVLDFLKDKKYRFTLKEISEGTLKTEITHLGVNHTSDKIPVYMMFVRLPDKSLNAVIAGEELFKEYLKTAYEQDVFNEYTYQQLLQAMEDL